MCINMKMMIVNQILNDYLKKIKKNKCTEKLCQINIYRYVWNGAFDLYIHNSNDFACIQSDWNVILN